MVISQRYANGFSLIELVIVILITGIMAAVAAPKYFDAVSSYRVKLASERIISDLEMAAEHARATNSPVDVHFAIDDCSYTMNQISDRNGSGETYKVNLAASPYGLTKLNSNMMNNTLSYDKYGRQDQQLKLVLRHADRGVYLIYDSSTRQIVELGG